MTRNEEIEQRMLKRHVEAMEAIAYRLGQLVEILSAEKEPDIWNADNDG